MDVFDLVSLASRWLHILPAIVLVGGTIFMRCVLVGALAGDGQCDELREAVRARWARLVMLSVALLLISGLYNAAQKAMGFRLDMTYNLLLLVKIVMALAVFYLASVLAGRSEMAQKFRQKESFWLNINVVLTIALVCIAGYLKLSQQQPKPHDRSGPATPPAAVAIS